MPATITVDEAQATLKQLISNLPPGEEVVLTENQRPVARLVSERPLVASRPEPGLCKEMVTIVADDEEHLKDFAEYLP